MRVYAKAHSTGNGIIIQYPEGTKMHAIRFDSENINSATTFLNFNNCTNYGAQLVLSVGAMSCSSAAVGYSSGMAGLIYSAALGRNLNPAISAEEADGFRRIAFGDPTTQHDP